MNGSDHLIYKERLNEFRGLIRKEFTPVRFKIEFGTLISVSLSGSKDKEQRIPRIAFAVTEEFMTDADSDFVQIFNQGITLAKVILENPPFPNRNFQGEIVLAHGGARFQRVEQVESTV